MLYFLVAFRCLQDWLRLASQRRRNYIIDQVEKPKIYLTICYISKPVNVRHFNI